VGASVGCSDPGGPGPPVEPRELTPGHGRKLIGAHPGVEIDSIRPVDLEMPVGGLGVLPDGRLVVATFDAATVMPPDPLPEPNGSLWILDNVELADSSPVSAERVADDLSEPLGVCIVDDTIYVAQRHEVTRFEFDHSSASWERAVVATGWETRDYHTFSFGLIHEAGQGGHPGYLYMARSTSLGGLENPPGHGSVWRIDLGGEPEDNIEYLTGGHRTPNGIGFGPENAIFVSDNQGEWTPANELNHVQKGHFYSFYQSTDAPDTYASPFQDPADRLSPGQGETLPAVQLPQGEIGNSPTEPILIPEGTPYAGQMLMGDMKYGGIQRLFLERINGTWQGAVFRFTMGLEVGVNRLTWGADGSLYAGGIGATQFGWSWINPDGNRTFQGLQRLRFTGVTAFEMKAVRATAEGFEIEFTKPVPRSYLAQPANYRFSQWGYRATPAYGGTKLNQESLTASAAEPSADGTRVRLTVPGLRVGRVVYIMTDPLSVEGDTMWSTEAWYTLNEIPSDPED